MESCKPSRLILFEHRCENCGMAYWGHEDERFCKPQCEQAWIAKQRTSGLKWGGGNDDLAAHRKVAEAAVRLIQSRPSCGIKLPLSGAEMDELKRALEEAGYEWEEWT